MGCERGESDALQFPVEQRGWQCLVLQLLLFYSWPSLWMVSKQHVHPYIDTYIEQIISAYSYRYVFVRLSARYRVFSSLDRTSQNVSKASDVISAYLRARKGGGGLFCSFLYHVRFSLHRGQTRPSEVNSAAARNAAKRSVIEENHLQSWKGAYGADRLSCRSTGFSPSTCRPLRATPFAIAASIWLQIALLYTLTVV